MYSIQYGTTAWSLRTRWFIAGGWSSRAAHEMARSVQYSAAGECAGGLGWRYALSVRMADANEKKKGGTCLLILRA